MDGMRIMFHLEARLNFPLTTLFGTKFSRGFSQGAGHAALIAKEVLVEGLVVFDGADDECLNASLIEQPADWMLDLVDASADRPRYALAHARTQTPPYVAPLSWLSLGLESRARMIWIIL